MQCTAQAVQKVENYPTPSFYVIDLDMNIHLNFTPLN